MEEGSGGWTLWGGPTEGRAVRQLGGCGLQCGLVGPSRLPGCRGVGGVGRGGQAPAGGGSRRSQHPLRSRLRNYWWTRHAGRKASDCREGSRSPAPSPAKSSSPSRPSRASSKCYHGHLHCPPPPSGPVAHGVERWAPQTHRAPWGLQRDSLHPKSSLHLLTSPQGQGCAEQRTPWSSPWTPGGGAVLTPFAEMRTPVRT